jgi:hypothetical protein
MFVPVGGRFTQVMRIVAVILGALMQVILIVTG